MFEPARKAAGLKDGLRPYDLRHSAASLWLHEGRSVVEVAAWLGHAPTMTLDTYAHLIAELDPDDERRTAEEEITRARTRFVPLAARPTTKLRQKLSETPAKEAEPTSGLEPLTPSLRVKCSTS